MCSNGKAQAQKLVKSNGIHTMSQIYREMDRWTGRLKNAQMN